MGFSPEHSTLVALVLNLTTKSITGQYHTVIDDNFTTVSTPEEAVDPQPWLDLLTCQNARVQVPFYSENDAHTAADKNDPIPDLNDEWLSQTEIEVRNATRQQELANTRRLDQIDSPQNRQQIIQTSVGDEGVQNDSTIALHANDGVELAESPTQVQTTTPNSSNENKTNDHDNPQSTESWQRVRLNANTRAINDSAQVNRSRRVSFADDTLEPMSTAEVIEAIEQQPPQPPAAAPPAPPTSSLRRSSRRRQQATTYNPGNGEAASKWIDGGVAALSAQINGLEISKEELTKLYALMAQIETQKLEQTHQPYAYAAKKPNDPNLPSLRKSLSGDEAPFYWEAMEKEIRDLEKRKTWIYVDRASLPPGTFVVPTLWAQRKKLTPSGELRKYKSRITCRGDLMKKHGVEQEDVFSPVCSWNSVRLVLALSLFLNLKTESLDFSNAFVQANLSPEQQFYIEVPIGFKTPKPNQVLKLKKSLYGTGSAPLRWYEKCDKGLRARGFKSSRLDPRLYISKRMIICLFAVSYTHLTLPTILLV